MQTQLTVNGEIFFCLFVKLTNFSFFNIQFGSFSLCFLHKNHERSECSYVVFADFFFACP